MYDRFLSDFKLDPIWVPKYSTTNTTDNNGNYDDKRKFMITWVHFVILETEPKFKMITYSFAVVAHLPPPPVLTWTGG